MCTATWAYAESGYDLLFNRDELRTRSPGLPPERSEIEGISILSPRDSAAGGTWIGVNERRVSVFLLNLYRPTLAPSAATRSRGELVHRLLASPHLSSAEERLTNTDLRPYAPFTLGVLTPSGKAGVYRWDGVEVVQVPDSEPPLSSSSYRTKEVIENRRRVYEEAIGAAGHRRVEELLEYHASHLPTRGPYSVCMHREDACTVSFTHICVRENRAVLRYTHGSPCSTATPSEAALFLSA